MKQSQNFSTLSEALAAIKAIGKAYSIMENSPLIASDNTIDCNTIKRDITEMKRQHILDGCTCSHPYEFFMVIRQHGQEGSTSKSHIIERCEALKGCIASMRLMYVHGCGYNLQFKSLVD